MVRESLIANEEVDILGGPGMAVCTNRQVTHERVTDSDACELLRRNAERIENTGRDNAIKQREIGQVRRARRLHEGQLPFHCGFREEAWFLRRRRRQVSPSPRSCRTAGRCVAAVSKVGVHRGGWGRLAAPAC